MRISDWSSDVCSSDLPQFADATMGYEMQYDGLGRHVTRLMTAQLVPNFIHGPDVSEQDLLDYYTEPMGLPRIPVPEEIGRASCRARVCQYVWIPVVAVSLTKKNINIQVHHKRV